MGSDEVDRRLKTSENVRFAQGSKPRQRGQRGRKVRQKYGGCTAPDRRDDVRVGARTGGKAGVKRGQSGGKLTHLYTLHLSPIVPDAAFIRGLSGTDAAFYGQRRGAKNFPKLPMNQGGGVACAARLPP